MATTRTILRLEQIESRDVPSTMNTIHTNPIDPTTIAANVVERVYSGDFDADGSPDDMFFWSPKTGANRLVTNVNTTTPLQATNPVAPDKITGKTMIAASGDYNGGGATNDMFFWDPVTGHNVLVLGFNFATPTVTTDPLPVDKLKGRAFTKFVAGDFNPGSSGTELFFWNPGTGRNLLASGVSLATPTVSNNPLLPVDIGRRYREVVAGDFNTSTGGDELFFWLPGSGNNGLGSNLATTPTFVKNTVDPLAIKGSFQVAVAGDLDPGSFGTELFFWNPRNGRNSLVMNISGPATVIKSPVDEQAIRGNAFKTVLTGAVLDADIGLFFWDPKTGRNWTIDE
jgi:hypothetical protein